MKFVSEKQLEEHASWTRKGALEGLLAGGAAAGVGSFALQRRWATYRGLPLSIKTLGVIIVAAPCLAIQAERRGLQYDKMQWEDEATRMLNEKQIEEDSRWQQMSTSDKMKDWAIRHQYSIILGGWAGSLAVAGAIVSRNKYQTFPQKIVQARVWAQALTIAVLIGAGVLTHSQRVERAKHLNTDHSWRDVLEQQERDRAEQHRLAGSKITAVA